ncbi:MAG: hypothetical protein ABI885_03140 [Gammaproteobacteria bacterium]
MTSRIHWPYRPVSQWALATALVLACVGAQAQTSVFNEVHTIAANNTGVPFEHDFTIGAAGKYDVTLTDLGAPAAPLATVKLAITRDGQVVGAPLVGPGTLRFDATPGTYQVRVIGVAGSDPNSGDFGVRINAVPSGNLVAGAEFSGSLALPPLAQPDNRRVLNARFTVTNAGDYRVTVEDLALPESLEVLKLALIAEPPNDVAQIVTALPANPADPRPYSATVHLVPNVSYRVFAVGQAPTTAGAGLYSVVVRLLSGGAPVFGSALPVGSAIELGSVPLIAGNYTLKLADLNTPVALVRRNALVVREGALVARVDSTPADATFVATEGTHQIFSFAAPTAAPPNAGSYVVSVRSQSGSEAFTAAQAVTTPGSGTFGYAFNTSLATAGTYRARLTDFNFPAALSSVSFVPVQGGVPLSPPMTIAGNLDVTGTAGALSVVVFAKPSADGGLFGLDVTPSAGGSAVFDITQGVGTLFSARKVPIASAGNYTVHVEDVGFPARFGQFAVVVTRGATNVVSILGGGNFSLAATPGDYFINFTAQPASPDNAGTYFIDVAPTPPPAAPTVTLAADVTQVRAGGTVRLTWSSKNASACTASDGWSGARNLSDTETSAPLRTSTKFTLSCSGAGGSASQSVDVAVDGGDKGGGGGAIDVYALMVLASLLAISHFMKTRRERQ